MKAGYSERMGEVQWDADGWLDGLTRLTRYWEHQVAGARSRLRGYLETKMVHG
jgi:hypothetical protein